VALCVIGWFAWRESRPTLAIAASELQPEPGQP
jgi:hypothetical protein